MNNNDVLRRIRYIFDFSDEKMIALFAQADAAVSRSEVSNWLKKDYDEEFVEMDDMQLAIFLNGLINDKRGKREGEQPPPERLLNNNIIFRKLKIALNMRDNDIMAAYNKAGSVISKHEISAFFRNPNQNQYRTCKDQFLRNFLKGLQIIYRDEKEA